MALDREQERLEAIAESSLYAAGVNSKTIKYCFRVFSRYLQGNNILEMGPAEGVMTNLLAQTGMKLTLVEGSKRFCEDLAYRFPQASVIHSLFEEFRPQALFNSIVMGHVLEHVIDPVAIVKQAATWLDSDGRILAAVPNSRSIHRQAAVMMGLLGFEEELNEADAHHGHRLVFNPETFRRVFLEAGLDIEMFGGYWMKPLANRQIESTWSDEMLDAFMRLGERYPDIAGEIYVIARRRPV